MKIAIPFRMVCAAALLMPFGRAEIIDRIAVSVGNDVITTSDLQREIRVTAFLNRMQPDFSRMNQRTTAERMIDQDLVRRELQLSKYPGPDPAAAGDELAEFRKQYFKTDAEFEHALGQAGISEQELKDEMLWQLTLLRFIEVRFQPGIQVSEEDIRNYFEKTVRPAAQTAHPGQPIQLSDYRDEIEETLTGQRADKELDKWLAQTRQRTEIVYHEEAFQ